MRSVVTALALVMSIIGWSSLGSAQDSGTVVGDSALEQMTATEIVERATDAYAGCETYLDTGVVTSVYHTVEGDKTDTQLFSLAFVRGCCLSFEFKGKSEDLKVWREQMLDTDASPARTWQAIPEESEDADMFVLSLAGAIGSTGGGVGVILSMLVPEHLGGSGLQDFEELSRIDNGEIDGVECIRIQGNTGAARPMTAWIHPTSLLVVRFEGAYSLPGYFGRPGFTADTVIDLAPELGVEMEPGRVVSGLGRR